MYANTGEVYEDVITSNDLITIQWNYKADDEGIAVLNRKLPTEGTLHRLVVSNTALEDPYLSEDPYTYDTSLVSVYLYDSFDADVLLGQGVNISTATADTILLYSTIDTDAYLPIYVMGRLTLRIVTTPNDYGTVELLYSPRVDL